MAAFVQETGQAAFLGADFVASQGQAVGRFGLLRISVTPHCIQVGGAAVTCVDGVLVV